MLSDPSSSPARRTLRARRTRRRRALPVIAVAAAGIVASVGLTLAPPSLAAAAASPLTASSAAVAAAASVLPATESLRDVAADADATLETGRLALAEAAATDAEIVGSGLELGAENSTIDTTRLRVAIAELANLDIVPLLLLPDAADDVATQTRTITARIAELRERLDTARTQRAAEEAAEEAAAAAAAAAAEAQRQAEAAAAALAAANTPEGARATAQAMAAERHGWGADQFSCLNSLWEKESNWNYQAYNASSGATGIPQSLPGSKMATAGADWQTNAATQIAWGLDYISRAYGSPCAAWGHSQATNWY
ncbi:phospholipase [Microbacterium sp. HD4P20]|uniref:aggregation-promoting factor C-terminal-like domain-containing protein n=1 Tax=Microbacterium sp. HD4P20 TaxID=2864874 RepID=UPI001C63CC6B|nr:phospholipase [Microbacterium sp. HD4P20]MCP2636153.1 phospholipase [Microbacterium sp. HD4P20]